MAAVFVALLLVLALLLIKALWGVLTISVGESLTWVFFVALPAVLPLLVIGALIWLAVQIMRSASPSTPRAGSALAPSADD